MKLATAWEDAARGKVTEIQARRVIGDVYAMISGERLTSSSIGEFFAHWLQRKKVETSPRTFDAYNGVSKQFLTFLGERSQSDLSRLTSKDVAAFRDSLLARLSPTTANHALKILRVALSQAKVDGIITENVADRVKPVSSKSSKNAIKRRAFTLPELRQIIAHADGEWRGMVLFGLYTGQRLKDIATLSWQNIDLERQEVRLVTSKTSRQQIMPLVKPLQQYLAEFGPVQDPKQPLFSRAHSTVARTGLVGALSAQFYDIMAAAGLVESRSHQKTGEGRSVRRKQSEISFHCLRHTATSLMKNAGISPAIVQEFIGHDSPAMSAHYTHIETSALRKAAESLPDISM